MSIVADDLHVRLAGDRVGRYVIADEHPDGTLVLKPEDSADAMLERHGFEPAGIEEFEAEHGTVGPAFGVRHPRAIRTRRPSTGSPIAG